MARSPDEIDTDEPTVVKPKAATEPGRAQKVTGAETAEPVTAMRWSTRPAENAPGHPDGVSVLLRWTEDLDDERAVTLWAGLSAVEDPAAREAALLRWIDWAGVTVPLGTRVRDLVSAVTQLTRELEATARNAERIFSLDPSDLLPIVRALHGWMRARETHPGVVVGAARAMVLAREVMRARAIDPPRPGSMGARETFEVIPATPGRDRVSSREIAEANANAPDPLAAGHAMLVATLRRAVERAPVDECAELLAVWLRAEHPTVLPHWASAALDFVLLDGDLRGHHPRAIASIAALASSLWCDLVRNLDAEPRDAVRSLRLLTALSQHTDLARELPGVPAQTATDALVRALEHPRFSIWSRAARTMGRLAGVMPILGPKLQSLVTSESASVLRNRACAALGDLSPFASAELRARRAAVLTDRPQKHSALTAPTKLSTGSLDTDLGENTSVWAVPEAALVAALAVALPDMAVDGTGTWSVVARSFISRGGPEAWRAIARSLVEIRQRFPETQAQVEALGAELHARGESYKGSGADAERAERVVALSARLTAPETDPSPSTALSSLARRIGQNPIAPGLRAHIDAFATALDVMVSSALKSVSSDSDRASTRGGMVLEEIADLLVDGDAEIVAHHTADGGARAAALAALDQLRGRMLKVLWRGLQRPTPASFAWRRWLLRAAGSLSLVSPTNKRIAVETVRDQVFTTLERIADDPTFGQGPTQRFLAAALIDLSRPLRASLGDTASAAVLSWLALRGSVVASHVRLRRWLDDDASSEAFDRLFRLLELLPRANRDTTRDIQEFSRIAGGESSRMGTALLSLATHCSEVSQRRPEPHWSGLPRFDLTDLCAVADSLSRVRDDPAWALSLDTERPTQRIAPPAESLTDRAGKLNRLLTATSLQFVDASRRTEVVEHYVSELGALCESIALASGPLLAPSVRGVLAKALVQVRALASEAIADSADNARWIGRLKVLGTLSSAHEGGMAATYLAEGPAPGKKVVLKLLPWARFRGAPANTARALFEGEMQRLTRVVHPNVVGIIDAGFVDEGAFIALEYIPGASLETLLNMLGPVAPRALAPMISDVASALAWLHRKGILHRDVKPANLLAQLDLPDGVELTASTFPHADLVRAVLIDFGIATEVSRAGAHEGVTGTPGYIAPEVARGVEPFGPGVDVYSLAVVCFEMLTATNPFLEGQPDLPTVLVRHGSVTLPWSRLPQLVNRSELITLLIDATRFDPRQRISMREFHTRWSSLSTAW